MHIEDLELCRYRAPFHADCWRAPLVAVGWLENPNSFSRGFATGGLYERIEKFVESAEPHFEHYHSRGLHACSLCDKRSSETRLIPYSFFSLLVPGTDRVYVAPAAILHYVRNHYYVPPAEFLEAVDHCPRYGSKEYLAALARANQDEPPPIETYEEYMRRFKEAIAARERQP